MAATCTVCGTKLGFGRRIAGKTLCEPHEAEQQEREAAEEARRQAATQEYLRVAATIASDPTTADRLPILASEAGMTEGDQASASARVVGDLLHAAIEDAYFSEEEEKAFVRMASALNLSQEAILAVISPYIPPASNAMTIAKLNAGRLPTIDAPVIFLKPKEVAHVEVEAGLLKEVVTREFRGGTSGFSFPIGMGIRYRVGAVRGRSVVVGTSLEVADKGVLCLTSRRAVFKGMRQSVECLYSKLVGVNVFDDGIQFHVSNRKNATLLRVGDGHLVASVVNAAMHPEGVAP